MYWKTQPRPKYNDQKRVAEFALFPTRCHKNHRHWLEHVYVVYRYSYGWWDKLYVDCDVKTKED